MPKIIDSDGEFPKYAFSSKEEVIEFFHQEIDRAIAEKKLADTYKMESSYFGDLAKTNAE